jgi:hypothetical protein
VAFFRSEVGECLRESIIGEVGGDDGFSFEPLWQRCRADVGLEAVRLRRGAVFQLALQFFFSFEVALYCTFQGSRDPMDLERRIYWLLGLGQVRVEGIYVHGPCWRSNGKIRDVCGRLVAGKEGKEIDELVVIG